MIRFPSPGPTPGGRAASQGNPEPRAKVPEKPERPQSAARLAPQSADRVSVRSVEITVASRLESISTNAPRSEEHTSELQSRGHLVCRLLLEKKKRIISIPQSCLDY